MDGRFALVILEPIRLIILRRLVLLLGCCVLLSACSSNHHYAPVIEGWRAPNAVQGGYRVQPGDTLYAIAWRFGHDYRELAAINDINPPYQLRVGQIIHLVPSATRSGSVVKPPKAVVTHETRPIVMPQQQQQPRQAVVKATTPAHPRLSAQAVRQAKARARAENKSTHLGPITHWYWPVNGRLVRAFGQGNKGIDIGGQMGEPVHATAPGIVVYSGHGIHGYGNLIIIKHNDEYLSAYAYNQENLVQEGQRVRARQVIAKMGADAARTPRLHFELRRAGKPVDPKRYLR